MAKTDKRQRKERGENGKIRAYFDRLFAKYDVRNEQQFISFCKWLIYILLLIVQSLILLRHLETFFSPKWWRILPLLINVVLFTLSETLKLFLVKNKKITVVFYLLNAVSACAFLFLVSGTYALIIYLLVLTEFYTTEKKGKVSMWIFILCVPLYALIYTARMLSPNAVDLPLPVLLQESIGAFVLLTAHFLVVQVALAFYRQFLRLDKTLKELNESKKELEKAYNAVREVSVLEERQRIAKEIHDTAGHSLTTVIMQTESARLIVEKNPEEAKSKITAANLQARHALEELRDSVHLLSGATAQKGLKDELISIIHESTDGTGIKIRSNVCEVYVSQAKHRFLCNTLKEGISNGLRHGGATAFWFECKQEDGKITFLLSDNGKGVDGNIVKKGFGLTTMEERARALGGEIAFTSENGEGFEIRLELPAEKKE